MAKVVGFSCLWESDWIIYLWYRRVVWLSSLVFSNSTRTLWGQWGVCVARFVVFCCFLILRKNGVSLRTLRCLLCLSEGNRARWMWLRRSSSSGYLIQDFTLRVLAQEVGVSGCGCWRMVMVIGFNCCDHLGCFRWGWLRGGYCNYDTIVQSSLKGFVGF